MAGKKVPLSPTRGEGRGKQKAPLHRGVEPATLGEQWENSTVVEDWRGERPSLLPSRALPSPSGFLSQCLAWEVGPDGQERSFAATSRGFLFNECLCVCVCVCVWG
eukprot:Sspe_Gene.28451::Locus_12915_Transcript_2_2_Confidence_1.000_Length_488::g.28451::m.28451